MLQSVSEYYISELADWNRSIEFYDSEITDMEDKLNEIIHQNTIPNLAANTERFLNSMDIQKSIFLAIQHDIQEQETRLFKNDEPEEHVEITSEAKENQKSLRDKMQAAEKNYIDAKYGCYNFLSGLLNK
ncbi:hypothetical protein [Flavihumibacter fluvii]|uniref:hypothetical protein n=1 Tax=Flavihumibacter fluvii TaxID=2838157 RepID=UPI001BDE75B8|nr:hypothetical protein [Flavihumibacter fluvii]ULQ54629.1 hypothetical protein KJS93_09890 [Flavihumibacter fluvii]